METQHDSKITRCPKLGDEITFSYCLRVAGDLPCPRIIRCWQAAFDADAALAEKSRRELFDRVVADKAMVTGYHFPFPAHGRLAKDGNGFVFTVGA